MGTIESRYGRSLKRKNFSPCTIKNYLHRIAQFRLWLRIPLQITMNGGQPHIRRDESRAGVQREGVAAALRLRDPGDVADELARDPLG